MAGEEEFGAANQTRYAGCAVRLVHPHFPGLIILQPNQHDAPMQNTLVRLTQDVRVPALLDQRRRLIISSVVGGSSVRLAPNPTGESDEHRKPPEGGFALPSYEYREHPLRPVGLVYAVRLGQHFEKMSDSQ